MTSFHATPISILNFTYKCENSYDCQEIKQRLKAGTYIFEVWGAQGGNTTENNGGRGGYSIGLISFYKTVNLYIFLGGKGISPDTSQENVCFVDTKRAFNGGGKSLYCNDEGGLRYGTSGGGATDIRINGRSISAKITL